MLLTVKMTLRFVGFKMLSEGLQLLDMKELLYIKEPVCNVSFYEAVFASSKGIRVTPNLNEKDDRNGQAAPISLPVVFKSTWSSLGEYNGKLMVNQIVVLRGTSDVTSPGQSRINYRNFFQPDLRWQLIHRHQIITINRAWKII